MPTHISRTLRLLRKENKLRQNVVADALEISQGLLSHYERGTREPGIEFVFKACHYYNVTTDFLLGLSGNRSYDNGEVETVPKSKSFAVEVGKQYLQNSFAILLDIANNYENLTQDLLEYFGTIIYQIFREIYAQTGEEKDDYFSVPEDLFMLAADANLAEIKMRISKEIRKQKVESLSQQILTSRYPQFEQSMAKMLHDADFKAEEKLNKEKKGKKEKK